LVNTKSTHHRNLSEQLAPEHLGQAAELGRNGQHKKHTPSQSFRTANMLWLVVFRSFWDDALVSFLLCLLTSQVIRRPTFRLAPAMAPMRPGQVSP